MLNTHRYLITVASKGCLVMWLEPLGEDRWLRPDETFRVRSNYDGDELAFSVTFWMDDDDRPAGVENVAVWIENGDCYAEVTDRAGNLVECGHQRPEDVNRQWQAAFEEAHRRAAERKDGGEAVGTSTASP